MLQKVTYLISRNLVIRKRNLFDLKKTLIFQKCSKEKLKKKRFTTSPPKQRPISRKKALILTRLVGIALYGIRKKTTLNSSHVRNQWIKESGNNMFFFSFQFYFLLLHRLVPYHSQWDQSLSDVLFEQFHDIIHNLFSLSQYDEFLNFVKTNS